MTRVAATLICSVSLLVQVEPVAAQADGPPAEETDGHRLHWDEDWNRFGTGELAAFSFLTVASYGMQFFLVPDVAGQAGGVLLDDWIREGLYLRSPEGRSAAATASDFLVNAALFWPFAVDTAGVAWIEDQNSDVAGQLFWMNMLSLMTTTAGLTFTKNVIRRERPYGRECVADRSYDRSCTGPDRFRSFYSGHAAYAFTGASLVCVHHAHLPLYGNDIADAAACGGAMAIATSVAILRIVADKHYFSDVVVGALLGFVSGFVMPQLLHYGLDPDPTD